MDIKRDKYLNDLINRMHNGNCAANACKRKIWLTENQKRKDF